MLRKFDLNTANDRASAKARPFHALIVLGKNDCPYWLVVWPICLNFMLCFLLVPLYASTKTPSKGTKMLKICNKYRLENNIIFNSKKTVCIKFGSIVIEGNLHFFEAVKLEWTDKVRHLGNFIELHVLIT